MSADMRPDVHLAIRAYIQAGKRGLDMAAAMQCALDEALASQAAPSLSQRHDWIACPVCAEPDMRRELFDEGLAIIQCTNHACASNGGKNRSALPQQAAQGDVIVVSRDASVALRTIADWPVSFDNYRALEIKSYAGKVWAHVYAARASAPPALAVSDNLQTRLKAEILDSMYRAGVKAGWNAAHLPDEDDAIRAYQNLTKVEAGSFAAHSELRAMLAAAPEPAP
ncbi:hypothetical protein [Nevskia ramosa]|uniref:hypothetical protein n=1 Tax=Nevskia ramosa TaxID=64002 RepID=UPI003D0B19B2